MDANYFEELNVNPNTSNKEKEIQNLLHEKLIIKK